MAKTREGLAAINYLKHINLCEPLLVNQLRFTLKRLDFAEFGWKADRVLAMLDSVFCCKMSCFMGGLARRNVDESGLLSADKDVRCVPG